MQRHLYLDGAHLYRETVPVAAGGNPFAYVWPFEEAAKATQCLLAVPDAGVRFGPDVEDRQHGRRRTGRLGAARASPGAHRTPRIRRTHSVRAATATSTTTPGSRWT